ncbi:MAG: hypothetical protein HRU38_14335 [Saccharospirillaceae bacterium]|nr:hypothetical protein [Pseudomonadales bacterium]NRB79821.1 hypothetical protein [Saccharospirillaceae bacterium]
MKTLNKLNIQRNESKRIIALLELNSTEFNNNKQVKTQLLSKDQKIQTLQLWQCFAETIFVIESIVNETSGNYILNSTEKRNTFYLQLISFLSAYRFALQFIEIIEQETSLVKLLEQKNLNLGLGESAYKRFKFHFLNVKMATRFHALILIYKSNSEYLDESLEKMYKEDKTIIYDYAKNNTIKLTLKNAVDILKTGTFKAWFPIQKGVANTIGNIKVWRNGHSLIIPEQVGQILSKIQPGDILLQRREWQATNIGIPGFWSHAALFMGNTNRRDEFFEDEEVIKWVKTKGVISGKYADLLKNNYPIKFENTLTQDNGYEKNVIESIAPGVVFTSLQQSLCCDSVVVLRPNLSKLEKAKALFNAFYYVGLPYDYNFNFQKDDALVCSELIYKSYQPSNNQKGIQFPLNNIAGRLIMPANAIAKMVFDEQNSKQQQLKMVLFLDGNESKQKAEESNQETFLKSCSRPKWHVFLDEK